MRKYPPDGTNAITASINRKLDTILQKMVELEK